MTCFDKARAWMYRNARPLDLARFQYHFESGSKEQVVDVLRFYQNADGGCGYGVEADCWNPNSTPMHSGTAGDILREIDFEDASHPFVQGLISFYLSGAHFDGSHWDIVVESNNQYPRSPWWTYGSESGCHTDYNGTAQIAGFLVRYCDPGSEGYQLGLRIANEAIAALDALEDMHTCTCYIHLLHLLEKADATHLIPADELRQKLHATVSRLLQKDADRWHLYSCKPSNFFTSMDSQFYSANQALAQRECEFILAGQQEDGTWPITWSWEDFPEEWAISKNWWKDHLIIQNLLYLKGMGRL